MVLLAQSAFRCLKHLIKNYAIKHNALSSPAHPPNFIERFHLSTKIIEFHFFIVNTYDRLEGVL